MCLSTVYKQNGKESEFLLKNIAKAEIFGSEIVFTDLMGVRTRVNGTITEIDLMENTIKFTDGE